MRFALCMIYAAVGAVHAEDTIDLHFYVRPPYMVKNGEAQASGLTADPAAAAFEKAGVRFRWQQTPAKRQLVMIESGNGLDCGVGWYKTPEREKFGKFTAPVYRDKPTVAITRAKFQPRDKSLAAVVADPATRVVMKVGLTYGLDIIAIMAKAKAQVQTVTTEQSTLARMVASGRVDFMFSPQEEAELLVAEVEREGEGLKVLTFSDVREGGTRHIMCSRRVSDGTIAKLNTALSRVPLSVK
ncbi:MAG: transporter substrate-binding domain-containing protein [Pseudomonadota bacterium]